MEVGPISANGFSYGVRLMPISANATTAVEKLLTSQRAPLSSGKRGLLFGQIG